MSDELARDINVAVVNRRIQLLNETLNVSATEITQTGRLRVSVEKAFRNAEDMIKLCGNVALLKCYADKAAEGHGQSLDQVVWNDIFRTISSGIIIMPSGKLS